MPRRVFQLMAGAATGAILVAGCVGAPTASESEVATLTVPATTTASTVASTVAVAPSSLPDPDPPTSRAGETPETIPEADLLVDAGADVALSEPVERSAQITVADAPAPPPPPTLAPPPPPTLGGGAQPGEGVPQSNQGTPASPNPGPAPAPPPTPAPSPRPAPSPTPTPAPAPPTTQAPPPPPPTTTPPPPPPPASQGSFSACTVLDPSPVNGWRSSLGLPALGSSSSLASASCAWSLEMAKMRSLTHGGANEVIHYSSQNGGAFSAWRNSGAHYNLLTTSDPRVTQIGCGMVRADYPDGATLFWSTCRMNW